jgi:hypothetical protein
MSKKNKKKSNNPSGFDPDLLREYMTGAANPGFSNKFGATDDVVDLHLEKIQHKTNPIHPGDALFHQLDKLEKAIDNAIAAGKMEVRIIHGLGKGKLREEIHKSLDKHPHVKSYSNEYHIKYGFGSTLVWFY